MILIVEHKTTSEDISPGADYWRRTRIDGQISTYFEGARALGLEADECLYDVIRKIDLRPSQVPLTDEDGTKIVLDTAGNRVRTKDGRKWRETASTADGYVLQTRPETVEEYRARCREEIAANPSKYYQRGSVVRLSEEQEDARYDTWQIARAIRESELAGRWPRNPDACTCFGRTCGFLPVCAREGSLDDETRYRRVERSHEELAPADGKVRLPLLTASSMRAFRRCMRLYRYLYVDGYRLVEDAEALRFGTLVHKGLEAWWRTVDLEQTIAAVREGAADDYERVRAEELLRGYHFRWNGEPLSVLYVEREFVAPLVNPETGASSKTFVLGGKIDAIAAAGAAGEEVA